MHPRFANVIEAVAAEQSPQRRLHMGALLGLLLVVAMFGGGGSPSVLAEGATIAAAFALAILVVALGVSLQPRVPAAVTGVALALPLIALLQLIPLPPAIWQALPGRETLVAALAAVGEDRVWWPFSIIPGRTLAALLSFAPPLLAFCLASQLTGADRTRCLWAFLAIGIASSMLAILQAVGGDGFYLYIRSIAGFPSGLFANHNAQGDALLIALCAGIALWFGETVPARRAFVVTAMALVLLGLLLSGSRTSLLLLVVPAGLALMLSRRTGAGRTAMRWRAPLLVGAGAVLLTSIVLLSDNEVFGRIAGRFGARTDARFSSIWPDSWFAATQLFPFGAGLGTFPQVFEAVERLEVIGPARANRAHLDYLELLIEAGMAGILVIVGALVVAVQRIRATGRSTYFYSDATTSVAWCTGLIVAAHSMVDYPLRAVLLACMFAIGMGLLFARRDVGELAG